LNFIQFPRKAADAITTGLMFFFSKTMNKTIFGEIYPLQKVSLISEGTLLILSRNASNLDDTSIDGTRHGSWFCSLDIYS